LLRVACTAFAVVLLAEWGDITQMTAANLAVRFEPLLVFAGTILGLWAVARVAVSVGAKTLDVITMAWVRRITATILSASPCTRLSLRSPGDFASRRDEAQR
jgi:Ca2+/H+ antiporter, TMEM165/GDT1 family